MILTQDQTRQARVRMAGFTLIELLVVISIVALLIAMLLPALNQARESAKRMVCTSNLHNMGIGLHAYATDSGVFPAQLNVSYYSPYVLGTNGTRIYNLGHLYTTGIVKPVETYYCPSAADPSPLYNSAGNPWLDQATSGDTTRSSYYYYLRSPDTEFGDTALSSYVVRRPEDFEDTGISILSDNIYQLDWLNHRTPPLFNVMRVDGSVRTIQDQNGVWFNAVISTGQISLVGVHLVFDYFDTY